MKALIGVAAGLIIGSVCTLATQAQATQRGCGWARGAAQDWSASSGHETYAACSQRVGQLVFMVNRDATNLVEFSCFSSDVDPRDKK